MLVITGLYTISIQNKKRRFIYEKIFSFSNGNDICSGRNGCMWTKEAIY